MNLLLIASVAAAWVGAADLPPDRQQIEDSLVPHVVQCATRTAKNQFSQSCGPSVFSANVMAAGADGATVRAFRYSGKEADREKRHMVMWRIPVKPGVAYQLSAWTRVLSRKCYIQPDLSAPERTWTGGRPHAHKGVFCGYPKLMVRSSQGKGMASVRPMFDFPYLYNQQGSWVRNILTFRNSPGDTTIDVSLEIDGAEMAHLMENLRLTEVSSGNGLVDELPSWPADTPYRFESIAPVTDQGTRVETRGTRWEWKRGSSQTKDALLLSNRASGKELARLEFPSGTFQTLSRSFLKKIPGDSRASEVVLESDRVRFILGVDGTAFFELKSDLSIVVRGGSASGERYSQLEAGVFFQAAFDGSGGFLMAPLYDRVLTTGLGSEFPAGSGQWIFSRKEDGTYVYRGDLFLQKAGRSQWFSPTEGSPQQVTYQALAGDRMILSSFPERPDTSVSSLPIYPSAALGSCDPLDPSSSAVEDCDQELRKLKAVGVKTVFLNSMKWTRSVQHPVEAFLHRNRSIVGASWTESKEYVGSHGLSPSELPACPQELPTVCTASLTSLTPSQRQTQLAQCLAVVPNGICRERIAIEFDPSGPWETSKSPLRNATIKAFLRKAKDQGLNRVLYVSPQFTETDGAGLLKQLDDLWNREFKDPATSERLIEGFYFDGFPEGRPIEALKVARGARALVGESGIVIHHLSTDATLLPDSYRYRPVYLEKYATIVAAGEGNKHSWGFDLRGAERDEPVLACPKLWGLMQAGRGLGGAGYLLFPELRAIDYSKSKEENENEVSLPPARQIEAQMLCGGAIWAPAHFKEQNGQWKETGFSFIEKHRSDWKVFFAPDAQGECGYWKRALNFEKPGFCPGQ